MDQAYSFNAPKRFSNATITAGTSPQLITFYVQVHPGVVCMQIQNIGSDYVYWYWGSVAPTLLTQMGKLPVDQILRLNWEDKDYDQLYIAGDSTSSRIVCLQEGK